MSKGIGLLYILDPSRGHCNGGSEEEMRNCCSSRNPCGLSEGDCDEDHDCKDGLICGTEGHGHGHNCNDSFYAMAECCQMPSK